MEATSEQQKVTTARRWHESSKHQQSSCPDHTRYSYHNSEGCGHPSRELQTSFVTPTVIHAVTHKAGGWMWKSRPPHHNAAEAVRDALECSFAKVHIRKALSASPGKLSRSARSPR